MSERTIGWSKLLRDLYAAAGPWPARVLAGVAVVVSNAVAIAALTQPIARCGTHCSFTARLDQALAASDPELLVVGNSMARRNVDMEVLTEGLGVDPDEALLLTLPGSSPGAWYALLKYRVFEKGYRPSRIVLVGATRAYWINKPISGADVSAMVQIAGTEDPVIRRVSGLRDAPSLWLHRAGLHRRIWRASLVEALVRTSRAWVGGADDDQQMEEMFGAGGGDADGLKNLLGGAMEGELGLASTVDRSYVPHLVSLAQQHDAELVFARVPPRRSEKNEFLEKRPEADFQLEAWLDQHEADYVDVEADLPFRLWADAWHLKPEGAVLYTRALVADLNAVEPP